MLNCLVFFQYTFLYCVFFFKFKKYEITVMLEIGYLTSSLFKLNTVDAGLGNGDMEVFARCLLPFTSVRFCFCLN